jgi:hypothetical protein
VWRGPALHSQEVVHPLQWQERSLWSGEGGGRDGTLTPASTVWISHRVG